MTSRGVVKLAVSPVTNRSGSITAGTTSQVAAVANTARKWLVIQNPSTETEPLYVEFGAVATIASTSMELEPGAMLLFDVAVPTDSINVNATSTLHKFFVLEG